MVVFRNEACFFFVRITILHALLFANFQIMFVKTTRKVYTDFISVDCINGVQTSEDGSQMNHY